LSASLKLKRIIRSSRNHKIVTSNRKFQKSMALGWLATISTFSGIPMRNYGRNDDAKSGTM